MPEDYDFDRHKELVPMQPGMCRLFMQIHRHWSVILDSSRVRICGRGYGSLRSGIRSFIRFKMIVEIILISVFL